jgi:hypothetical protein
MQSTMFAVPPLDGQEIADEWSYCAALGKTECASRLESHFGSYIVEADFREIAQRGLNTCVSTLSGAPGPPLELTLDGFASTGFASPFRTGRSSRSRTGSRTSMRRSSVCLPSLSDWPF